MQPLEVLRTYTKQFDGDGHTPASAEEIVGIAKLVKHDLDVVNGVERTTIAEQLGRLAKSAARRGIPFDEYVGAIDHICAYTCVDVGDAEYEIERVLGTFRELDAIA